MNGYYAPAARLAVAIGVSPVAGSGEKRWLVFYCAVKTERLDAGISPPVLPPVRAARALTRATICPRYYFAFLDGCQGWIRGLHDHDPLYDYHYDRPSTPTLQRRRRRLVHHDADLEEVFHLAGQQAQPTMWARGRLR